MSETEKTRLDELEALADAAAEEHRRLKSELDHERWEAMRSFEQKLNAEVLGPKYNALIEQARDLEYETARAVTAEKDRLAAVSTFRWPVGTRFVQWERYGGWGNERPTVYGRKRMGKSAPLVGVLEVVTSKTKFAKNLRWSKPGIGQAILRLLKNDGTPSNRIVQPTSYWISGELTFSGWFPEGVDPNTLKESEQR